ncbi:unnamed protein product [Rotaria sp. Silwood1]|nr:unnamed protein product [Rotaria sp. Silwood1]CAF4774412.1 unnamed protein product [Rotaria sp. Silwood1]
MKSTVYLVAVIVSTLIIGGIFGLTIPTVRCPPGRPRAACLVDPCSTSTCPEDKNAKCVSYYCGGCYAVWYRPDGRRARCFTKTRCPPGQRIVKCFRDPCQGATCPRYPDATCVSNYCGGCKAEWFRCDGQQVQCTTTS